jgi:hypothetical protein
MRFFLSTLALAACLTPKVSANTPLDNGFVLDDLARNKGFEIAFASRP